MSKVNALTAESLLDEHFMAAAAALEDAKHATAANPADARSRIEIANAHIRLAEIAAGLRFRSER